MILKPFLKWAGGKRKLLPTLKQKIPEHKRYSELFIGGGALFFELNPQNAIINDINEELINLYKVIKDTPKSLINDLKKHINTREYFIQIRNLDRNKEMYRTLSDLERASRFIFLNRTCFNGLYRVNQKGEFNVSYGKYKNPDFIQEKAILKASEVLQNTTIWNLPFQKIKPDFFNKDDFIYLDPPYIPLNQTSNFTQYSKEGFYLKEQEELVEFIKKLNQQGVKFLLSNSYTKLSLELYKEFKIEKVQIRRNIAGNANARGNVYEILVYNY